MELKAELTVTLGRLPPLPGEQYDYAHRVLGRVRELTEKGISRVDLEGVRDVMALIERLAVHFNEVRDKTSFNDAVRILRLAAIAIENAPGTVASPTSASPAEVTEPIDEYLLFDIDLDKLG